MALKSIFVTGDCIYGDGFEFPCAFGKGGFTLYKREGDGATPRGLFPLRQCLYRADRHPAPQTELPLSAIAPDDSWCDDPASQFYNLPVKLPFIPSHEKLWRDDHAYDFIVPIGYNDLSPTPGLGSAIFLHLAKPGYLPTEGCIAVALEDMLAMLPLLGPETLMDIEES